MVLGSLASRNQTLVVATALIGRTEGASETSAALRHILGALLLAGPTEDRFYLCPFVRKMRPIRRTFFLLSTRWKEYHRGMEKKRPVAVFDLDGTLFRSNLLIELTEELVSRGMFPEAARKPYKDADGEWQTKKGEYGPLMRKAIDAFGKYAKGLPYGEIADIAGELIEANRDRTFHYTRDLVTELKKKGYFLLVISYSPKFIVDGFAYELGFDKSYGVFYDTGASSRFTGEVVDEHLIMNKGAILTRAVEKNKLTLSGSYGVGSTETDTSMLDLVETPIAFNPNRVLYRHAQKHLWPIVVEHKDVIYEI
jgi:HAD superfamily hydrolase (TIGR01490 family)